MVEALVAAVAAVMQMNEEAKQATRGENKNTRLHDCDLYLR